MGAGGRGGVCAPTPMIMPAMAPELIDDDLPLTSGGRLTAEIVVSEKNNNRVTSEAALREL